MNISKTQIKNMLNDKCLYTFGCTLNKASEQQIYKTTCLVVKDLITNKSNEYDELVKEKEGKQVYYMSMEFLVGTSLKNNLYNLNLENDFKQVLSDIGVNIEDLYKIEPDAGLGNGGLGRLASCYMDSLTTLSMKATGYSLRYEFGIFKQKIIDGWQMEFPDNWLDLGDVWLKSREDTSFEIKFGGEVVHGEENGRYKPRHINYDTVIAVPYDMYITGYDTNAVNKLVLWSAKSPKNIDMNLFSRGDYVKALEENTMAEAITKVLYPADDHIEGKRLRLKQQYVLVSASIQNILKDHMEQYNDIQLLPEKVAIHINDTHPALCVPELMRILLDDYNLDWDNAFDICNRTLFYTNHTVMSEALEKWPEFLFKQELPRIYTIVCEINRRFVNQIRESYPNDFAKIDYMSIISNNEVKMANLCLACVNKVNGVSKLHSDILKNSIFKDFYNITPNKFTNVTNGIAYRRWLCQSNPNLTNFLKELIGDGFIHNSLELEKLLKYKDDKNVLDKLKEIKFKNKQVLAELISKENGVNVDCNSIFDVQIKRLHEYKRQLLNVLNILNMYIEIKENPNLNIPPRTFIFSAKASSGYFMAKQIIRLINYVSNLINNDAVVRDKIKVIFIEDYKVSLAQIIIPSADISEQISVAGKEASGTGNMKLMLNGAVTVGTLDGANVEIFEQVGEDNIFLFGLKAHEVEELWRKGYNPLDFYNNNERLKQIINILTSGVLGYKFFDIADSLLTNRYGVADAYMTLADFNSYVDIQKQVSTVYQDKYKFNNMSLVNIAKAGVFSSDISISNYAKDIWHIKGIK